MTSQEVALTPLDRLDATLRLRRGLRLRIACPSQEFSAEEMSFGVGRWLSSSRGLWETLELSADHRLALIMVQAPAVGPDVEDYLLRLVPPGATSPADRRARHALVELDDDSERHLSEKVLANDRLIARLCRTLELADRTGHTLEGLACFASSPRMAALATALGVPLLESDPRTLGWGHKSGSRQVFRAAGVPHPPGSYVADHDVASLAARLAALVRAHGPGRWMVKLDRGFGSGHGNALVDITTDRSDAIERDLRTRLRPLGDGVRRSQFLQWLAETGAVTERHLDAAVQPGGRQPSALARLTPHSGQAARVELLGVHDQLVGDGGDYLGCRHPAASSYSGVARAQAHRVFTVLAARGVVGHVGVDFLPASSAGTLFATEINIRQTGSTHPHRTVRAVLPEARSSSGELTGGDGHQICFRATDTVIVPSCRGIEARHLIAALRRSPRLALDCHTGRGVVPHLWPALSRFGKIGVTAIGRSAVECDSLLTEFTALLERLGAARRGTREDSA
ncbi:hypothetical protein [Streptomyces iakyrus]|uniref:hypothetical protein n=1 Tax=Streptomyces iakyrus TaxID=68219 RepID=UPI003D921654